MTQSGHRGTENPAVQRTPAAPDWVQHSRGVGSAPPRFRTIQVCPKDCPSARWQAEYAGTHALRPQGESTMSEQAVAERRGWASDILWVVLYSILVLLVMLLWIYVPA